MRRNSCVRCLLHRTERVRTVEQEALKIEGISPGMLWTFLVVLVGLMAIVVLGDKVMDVYRNAKKRKAEREQLQGTDVTDRIADKVMEKLEPKLNEKFDEIDRKLAADKETIESHTVRLNDHEGRVSKLEGGNMALCHGMLALLKRDPTLVKEQKAMENYLIDGKYKKGDWE